MREARPQDPTGDTERELQHCRRAQKEGKGLGGIGVEARGQCLLVVTTKRQSIVRLIPIGVEGEATDDKHDADGNRGVEKDGQSRADVGASKPFRKDTRDHRKIQTLNEQGD